MSVIDLSPKKVDLLGLRMGDRNAFQITVTAGGEPVPLNGYVITAHARHYPTADEFLEALIEDIDEEAGSFTVRWPGEEMRTFIGPANLFEGCWDLQIVSGENDPHTFCYGRFQALSDVTR